MDSIVIVVVFLQANAMNERIGYPEFILNRTELDSKYAGVSAVMGKEDCFCTEPESESICFFFLCTPRSL